MPCVYGPDADNHLHNLPRGPPLSDSVFEDHWAPNFVEVLANQFQTVHDESEPSKSIRDTPRNGGDAQATIHPLHRWAKTPAPFDHNRRLLDPPTPNLEETIKEQQMVKEALMRDWRRNSDNPRGARERPRPSNVEDEFQVFLPPAKRAMHISPSKRRNTVSTNSLPNALAQPTPDPSMKLATQSLPIQHRQRYTTFCSPPLHRGHDHSEKSSPAELDQHRRHTSRASPDLTLIKKENRASPKCEAKAVDLDDILNSRTADSEASIPERCLCDCGGNALRCLRPNRPPSPNTFFETFWAPNFAYMLKTRLDIARNCLEPSKRIWWREEFGGCAPDRRPLVSEIWSGNGDDWGDLLRTSPPPLYDLATIRRMTGFQPSRNRQRSASLPNRPIRSLDEFGGLPQECKRPFNDALKSVPLYESGRKCERSIKQFADHCTNDGQRRPLFRELTVAQTAKPLKSPTQYIPDKLPPIKIPDLSKEHSSFHKRKQLTAEEREELLRSALQKLEIIRLRRQRRIELPLEQRKLLPAENLSSTSKGDSVKESQTSVEVMNKVTTTEQLQPLNQSLYQKIEAMKLKRNRRHGVALFRQDRLATDLLPPMPQVHQIKELPRDIDDRSKISEQNNAEDACIKQDVEATERRSITVMT